MIMFKTGMSMGSGTDANVSLELLGSTGKWWRPKALGKSQENPGNPFESGKMDSFIVESEMDLGEILKVRIVHDGKGWGDQWQLAALHVTQVDLKRTWEFTCGDGVWLKKNTPIELLSSANVEKTNVSQDSESSASFFSSDTPKTNQWVKHTNQRIKEKKVIKAFELERKKSVDEENTTEKGLLQAGERSESAGTNSVESRQRTVTTASHSENTKELGFNVVFTTGTSMGAGTDANVMLELWSENSGWSTQKLEKSMENPSNPFENGKNDTFEFLSVIDLGTVKKIRVSHDGKGFGGDWQLSAIVINDLENGIAKHFPCKGMWVKKNKPVEIVAS